MFETLKASGLFHSEGKEWGQPSRLLPTINNPSDALYQGPLDLHKTPAQASSTTWCHGWFKTHKAGSPLAKQHQPGWVAPFKLLRTALSWEWLYPFEFKERGRSKECLKVASLTLWVDRRDLKENGSFSIALCIRGFWWERGGPEGREQSFRYC